MMDEASNFGFSLDCGKRKNLSYDRTFDFNQCTEIIINFSHSLL